MHLRMGEVAREELSLRKVFFVPSFIPPHKPPGSVLPAKYRVEMLKLALRGNPSFALSLIEVKRKGVSYTVDTLLGLKRKYPGREWVFIMGSDSLKEIHTWKDWRMLLSLCDFFVFRRKDEEITPPDGYVKGDGGFVNPESGRKIMIASHPLWEISGEYIRRCVVEGKSIKYLVPPDVERYIKRKKLKNFWKRCYEDG